MLRRMKKEVKIIAHPAVFQAKYDRREGKASKFIGIPFQREELESLGARFLFSEVSVKISEDIMTTGALVLI